MSRTSSSTDTYNILESDTLLLSFPPAANKEYTRDRLLGNRWKVQNYRFPSSFSFFYNGDLMHFLIRQGGGGNRTLEGPQSISSRNPRSPRQSIRQTRFSQSITS